MKKRMYYVVSFMLIPTLLLLCELLDNTRLLDMSSYVVVAILGLACIAMGIISPTNKKFDYVLAVIMPMSLFFTMMVVGFLNRGDLGTLGLSITDAFETALQPGCLIAYSVMAIMIFLASFRAIRHIKISTEH